MSVDSKLFQYDREKWAIYEEIRDAMGMLAPSKRYMIILGYSNPRLMSVRVDMKRNGLRLWSRAGVMEWIERKFKAHPDYVEQVRAELLPNKKRKAKKQ